MRRINRWDGPRPENVLTAEELHRLTIDTLFVWGHDDPYLSAEDAEPKLRDVPAAELAAVPGRHVPWLDDTQECAERINSFLA